MKNLTIKKVALGLVLAGYAASGAFAATSATTASTIIGNAPTIATSAATGAVADKYDLKFERNISGTWTDIATLTGPAKNLQTGDRINVSFDLVDADGDQADPDWTNTSFTGDKAGKQFVLTVIDPAGNTTVTGTMVTPTSYTFVIPVTAAGKSIDVSLTPMTEFGNPVIGSDITGNLFLGTNTVGPFPPTCSTIPTPASCITPSVDGLKVQIFNGATLYGSSDATEHGAIPATVIPKVGDTFTYKVIDTLNGNADVTTTYKGQWSYAGNNSAALGAASAAATVEPTTPAVGATYKIDVNSSDILSTGNSYEAGGQGFNLKVDISL